MRCVCCGAEPIRVFTAITVEARVWRQCLACPRSGWLEADRVWNETGPLTDLERELLRHSGCAFGHSACLPDIWLPTLEILQDGSIWSEVLGTLFVTGRYVHVLITRRGIFPDRPLAKPPTPLAS